jgi:endogenous inhibitor of DNA gyrase (YacG/DUF329 family)
MPNRHRQVTVIDMHPTRDGTDPFSARPPTAATAPPATELTERRGRHSGQVDDKPCPRCQTPVTLDPGRMRRTDGRVAVACPTCGTRVDVRHADQYRPAPEASPEAGPKRKRFGWREKKAPTDTDT